MATKYRTERQARAAQQASVRKWTNAHMTSIAIRLHNENDADVIARIKAQPNQADYIRSLVRADVEKDGE